MWRRNVVAAALFAWAAAVAAAQTSTQPPVSAAAALPAGAGADTVRAKCLACHAAQPIVQQRLARDGWGRELDKMAGWGAVITAAERATLLDYLTAHFGPSPATAAADDTDGPALLETRCLACHDMRLIEQQRLTVDGWRRELDKMIGWGAPLSQGERDALAAHLARRYPVTGTR